MDSKSGKLIGTNGSLERSPSRPERPRSRTAASAEEWQEVFPPKPEVRDWNPPQQEPRENARSATLQVHQDHEERASSWPAAPRGHFLATFQKYNRRVLRRIARLNRTRDNVLHIRSELVFSRQQYQQRHKFVDESQRTFLKVLDDMVRTEEFIAYRQQLHSLYGECRGDLVTLEQQRKTVQDLEYKLRKLEYSMLLQERALAEAIGKVNQFRQLDLGRSEGGELPELRMLLATSTDDPSLSEHGADSIDAPSSAGDPLLVDYFDKAGDVNVMKDRLFELENEHADRQAKRAQQEDQGLILPDVVDEFELAFQAERKEAQNNLDAAVKAKERALKACHQEGIDPEDHKPPRSEQGDDALQMSNAQDAENPLPGPDADFPTGILITGDTLGYNETSEGLEQDPTKLSNIEHWIDQIEGDQADASQIIDWLDEIGERSQGGRPLSLGPRYVAWKHGEQVLENFETTRNLGFSSGMDDHRSRPFGGVPNQVSGSFFRQDTRSRSSSESRLASLRRFSPTHQDAIRRLSDGLALWE